MHRSLQRAAARSATSWAKCNSIYTTGSGINKIKHLITLSASNPAAHDQKLFTGRPVCTHCHINNNSPGSGHFRQCPCFSSNFSIKLTIAVAGWLGSISANRWHALSVTLPLLRATKPNSLQHSCKTQTAERDYNTTRNLWLTAPCERMWKYILQCV